MNTQQILISTNNQKTFCTLVDSSSSIGICQHMADEALCHYPDPYMAAYEYRSSRIKQAEYRWRDMPASKRSEVSPQERYQMMTVMTIILIAQQNHDSPYEEKVNALLYECRNDAALWRILHDAAYDIIGHSAQYAVSCIPNTWIRMANKQLHYLGIAKNGPTATINLNEVPPHIRKAAIGKLDALATRYITEKAMETCFPAELTRR